jgi:hypothetical protein
MYNEEEIDQTEDEFDAHVSGPWMHRWPILYHTKHTAHAGIVPN